MDMQKTAEQIVLDSSGFSDFNPVQKMALEKGLLEGKSLIVAAPTASGKTLVAELAAVNTFLKGRKTVYIVPLKALASGKYREFNEKYNNIGMKTAMSIGNLDEGDPWLGKYYVINFPCKTLPSESFATRGGLFMPLFHLRSYVLDFVFRYR